MNIDNTQWYIKPEDTHQFVMMHTEDIAKKVKQLYPVYYASAMRLLEDPSLNIDQLTTKRVT